MGKSITQVGSLVWAQHTQGRLSSKDKFAMTLQGVQGQFKLLVGALFGHNSGLVDVDVAAIVEPDSQLARFAREKMQDVCSQSLGHHNYRAYLWASLLAQACGHKPDPEILFVACMLHDLGLTQAHHGCSQGHCFTLDSVQASAEVLAKADQARADRVRESILLHINIDIPGDLVGWEAHYLGAGTAFDVVGARWQELPQAVRHQVIQQYPALDLKTELMHSIKQECSMRPDSRFALLAKLGLLRLLQKSPLC